MGVAVAVVVLLWHADPVGDKAAVDRHADVGRPHPTPPVHPTVGEPVVARHIQPDAFAGHAQAQSGGLRVGQVLDVVPRRTVGVPRRQLRALHNHLLLQGCYLRAQEDIFGGQGRRRQGGNGTMENPHALTSSTTHRHRLWPHPSACRPKGMGTQSRLCTKSS